MWILVSGCAGSAKHLIVEHLKKDGFQFLEFKPPIIESRFIGEFRYVKERLMLQFEAQKIMNKKNIVTVRSFWDSMEVFVPLARKSENISDSEEALLLEMRDFYKVLDPPHAIVWTRADDMDAFNRMALTHKEMNQEEFKIQRGMYTEFMEKVRVPSIEVDSSIPFETMKKNLEFGLASLKTTTVSNQSIWGRTFFR